MSYSPSVAFLGGSVGTSEWVVLFVVVLIVVGPKRMPELARKLGRMMEMFRRAADEFKDQLMTMDQEKHSPPAPSVTSDSSGSAEPSDSYDNPYPDASGYPGNEEQAGNAAADFSDNEGPVGNAAAAPLSDMPGPDGPSDEPVAHRPAEGAQ